MTVTDDRTDRAVTDNRAEWWSHGACLAADPDLFFPISESGPARRQVTAAKAVCAGCQVRERCLSYALTAGPMQGVWGGTSEEERRALGRHERPGRAPRSLSAVRRPKQHKVAQAPRLA
jgi:WhiB family transcriptional regulator, redox-sensing transcriptional regulator